MRSTVVLWTAVLLMQSTPLLSQDAKTIGPIIAVDESNLANDGFPAIGFLDLHNLSSNWIRFDAARNIAPPSDLWNDPGDSITVSVLPSFGFALTSVEIHWRFAVRNPLFDAVRDIQDMEGMDFGGVVVGFPDRWWFDLPDGPDPTHPGDQRRLLFPGDVLHYYISATQQQGVNFGTTTSVGDLSAFGNPTPMAWPTAWTVNCLPSLRLVGEEITQPGLLFWNDGGSTEAEDEWYGALLDAGLTKGTSYDVYNTRAPNLGLGNGLGGRASVGVILNYTDMLYSSGTASQFTLCNGYIDQDPSLDLALLNAWFIQGGRDLFATGDDLARDLSQSGILSNWFLTEVLGVNYVTDDVRSLIDGQGAPVVVREVGDPVFTQKSSWIADGTGGNDFDGVTATDAGQRVALFTDWGGVASNYTVAAAVLRTRGTNRTVFLPYDLYHVIDWLHKSPAPLPARAMLLISVLDFFGVSTDPGNVVPVPRATAFSLSSFPNPFNPSLTIGYTLSEPGRIVLKVFDVRGGFVKTLFEGTVAGTAGSVTWTGVDEQGTPAASGVYLVELDAGGEVMRTKVSLVR